MGRAGKSVLLLDGGMIVMASPKGAWPSSLFRVFWIATSGKALLAMTVYFLNDELKGIFNQIFKGT